MYPFRSFSIIFHMKLLQKKSNYHIHLITAKPSTPWLMGILLTQNGTSINTFSLFCVQVPSMISSNLDASALQYLQSYLQAANVQLVWGAGHCWVDLLTPQKRRRAGAPHEELSCSCEVKLLSPVAPTAGETDVHKDLDLNPPNEHIALDFSIFVFLLLCFSWHFTEEET